MADPFIGEIRIFAGNFAPQGWLPCDGRLLAISQNNALFSLLGTTYGGNGQTTFGLPDLRGRVVVSFGQAPGRANYAQGETGGQENLTLSVNQLPSHTHTATVAVAVNAAVPRGPSTATSPAGAVPGPTTSPSYVAAPDGSTKMNAGMVTVGVTNAAVGSGALIPTLPPFQVINYIIATQGIFPSRP
jgi:microcystin-dependent protein